MIQITKKEKQMKLEALPYQYIDNIYLQYLFSDGIRKKTSTYKNAMSIFL